jgi:hypothetical protein
LRITLVTNWIGMVAAHVCRVHAFGYGRVWRTHPGGNGKTLVAGLGVFGRIRQGGGDSLRTLH